MGQGLWGGGEGKGRLEKQVVASAGGEQGQFDGICSGSRTEPASREAAGEWFLGRAEQKLPAQLCSQVLCQAAEQQAFGPTLPATHRLLSVGKDL